MLLLYFLVMLFLVLYSTILSRNISRFLKWEHISFNELPVILVIYKKEKFD